MFSIWGFASFTVKAFRGFHEGLEDKRVGAFYALESGPSSFAYTLQFMFVISGL